MPNKNAVGGTIKFRQNGILMKSKGNFTYNLGIDKRNTILGHGGVHGYSTEAQEKFIEGAITKSADMDLKNFFESDDGIYTLEEETGTTIMLSEAWFAGDGNVTTEAGEIGVKFVGMKCEEI